MNRNSPIRKIAFQEFLETFKDLLSVRAQISYFEKYLIEGTYEIMWFEHYEKSDWESWKQTVRATYYFLDKGSQKKYQPIAEKFQKAAHQMVEALNDSFVSRQEALNKKLKDEDTQIKKHLDYYKVMYERLVPIIMSPIIYAFGVIHDIKNKGFIPREDGKIDLNTIEKMEKWRVSPQNRLAIGLNKHVRNAYAHESYKILDDGKVELWDVDPRNPKKKWGPEIWEMGDLRRLCNELWLNSLAVVIGLTIYSLNNRRDIFARGCTIPSSKPRHLRREELKNIATYHADGLGFDLNKITSSQGKIEIELSTRLKGIDQDEEILFGGNGWAKGFKVPVEYVEAEVIEQVIGLLQWIAKYLNKITEISVNVENPNKKIIGNLVIDFDILSKIKKSQRESIEDVRKSCKLDTLGNSSMWVKITKNPRRF